MTAPTFGDAVKLFDGEIESAEVAWLKEHDIDCFYCDDPAQVICEFCGCGICENCATIFDCQVACAPHGSEFTIHVPKEEPK